MARFQTELDNLQQQQREAIDRLQTLEVDATKLRELILKLSGGIEVLQALNEREEQAASEPAQEPTITPEVVE